jgi:hypothetical protein
MKLSRKEKLELMQSLNWDFTVTAEEMLAVLEGEKPGAGSFDRNFLFVRSLERLPWHDIIGLWGVEEVKTLYTPENIRRLWPKDLRRKYDFALAILRREPVSFAEWGSPDSEQLRNTVFSHRWYRT